jgi:hypothetical protein
MLLVTGDSVSGGDCWPPEEYIQAIVLLRDVAQLLLCILSLDVGILHYIMSSA